MPVRKTERRIPFYFQASDLGQHVGSSDGKAVLISYMSSPVVVERLQCYVVFVTDGSMAGQVDHYDWRIQNGATNDTVTTQKGYLEHTPQNETSMSIQVELKSSSNQTLASLQLQQTVIATNADLENLIEQEDVMAPTAGRPATSREIINDVRIYIDQIAPRDLDTGSSLNRILFGITYLEAQASPAQERLRALEEIAEGLEIDDLSMFISHSRNGIGLCKIRPYVLAMYFSSSEEGSVGIIPKRNFPEDSQDYEQLVNTLLDELEALPIDQIVDLFNLMRFPKANIAICKIILDGIKADHLSSDSYLQIISDRDKGISLIKQYKEGPYILTP